MMPENEVGRSTQRRLIEAAGELFAEKGFKETTVRDISERAGANLASINYHFGDKEKLYEEVILHILDGIWEEFPIDKNMAESSSAEERLSLFVKNTIRRFIDPERSAWHGILLARERMNPRPSILPAIHKTIAETLTLLSAILQDLLGPGAQAEDVELCMNSIMGQIFFQAHLRSENAPPLVRKQPATDEEVGILVDHITAFSLAGIRQVRKAREDGDRE
jgi:AcrR family transcriptional regulator